MQDREITKVEISESLVACTEGREAVRAMGQKLSESRSRATTENENIHTASETGRQPLLQTRTKGGCWKSVDSNVVRCLS